MICLCCSFVVNVTATTEIYTYSHTLSLHDALPILPVTILGRVLPTIGTDTVIRSFFFQARLVIAWYVLFLVLFVATRWWSLLATAVVLLGLVMVVFVVIRAHSHLGDRKSVV